MTNPNQDQHEFGMGRQALPPAAGNAATPDDMLFATSEPPAAAPAPSAQKGPDGWEPVQESFETASLWSKGASEVIGPSAASPASAPAAPAAPTATAALPIQQGPTAAQMMAAMQGRAARPAPPPSESAGKRPAPVDVKRIQPPAPRRPPRSLAGYIVPLCVLGTGIGLAAYFTLFLHAMPGAIVAAALGVVGAVFAWVLLGK